MCGSKDRYPSARVGLENSTSEQLNILGLLSHREGGLKNAKHGVDDHDALLQDKECLLLIRPSCRHCSLVVPPPGGYLLPTAGENGDRASVQAEDRTSILG